MLPKKHEYQHEGLRRAKAEGRAEGKAESRAELVAEGKALALFHLLEVRGLVISPAQRTHILECTDLQQLRAWIAAAVTARTVDDVLTV